MKFLLDMAKYSLNLEINSNILKKKKFNDVW